jgi:hypothetical protein
MLLSAMNVTFTINISQMIVLASMLLTMRPHLKKGRPKG